MFEFYKKGQGKWTRGLTMGGIALVVLLGASWLFQHPLVTIGNSLGLSSHTMPILQWVGTVLFILGGLYLGFWASYLRPGTGDFFIATEGEMKKVSWSSRTEIIGSTKVVIFTLFGMGLLLFVVDLMFMLLFQAIGVLRITGGFLDLLGLSGGT